MRTRLIIAAQSGVVIGLVGLVLYQGRQLREAHRQFAELPTFVPEVAGATNARPVRLRLQQLPPIQIRNQTIDLDWRTIESEDYTVYVANLRRIGCPEETIRDIIRADVGKLFDAKRRALVLTDPPWEFWKSADPRVAADPEASAAELKRDEAISALAREQRQLLVTLLGPAATEAEFTELREEQESDRALRFLEAEKRTAVASALARAQMAEQEALRLADPDERFQAVKAARLDLDAEFARLLTPEEREQYELRASGAADQLRSDLVGFSPSREEFEALFRIRRQSASENAQLAGPTDDPQYAEKAAALQLEQEETIRKSLGDARYQEYRRSSDPDYQVLYSLTAGHDVPANAANQVWDMRNAVEAQTDRIRSNPLLTVEQKVRALEAIRDTTAASIVDVLGEPLLQAYQQSGGHWLEDLTAPIDLGESGVPIIEPPLPPGVESIVPAQALSLPPQ